MGIDLGRFRSKNSEEWDDWLSDDPVPATFRERMGLGNRSRQAPPIIPVVHRPEQAPVQRPVISPVRQQPPIPLQQVAVPDKGKNHAVSIHISIPKFKKLDLRQKLKKLPPLPKKVTYKQVGMGAGALSLVLVVGIIAVSQKDKGAKPGSTGVLSASNQKPNFAYSLPSGAGHEIKPEDVRYDTNKKLVNFKDTIGGIQITISQQPLPSGFKEDTQDKVKKLAEDFSANKTIPTANPTAYIGTSVKGPQTVIFSKKDLLVFIQSAKEIDEHDWAEYITNLK